MPAGYAPSASGQDKTLAFFRIFSEGVIRGCPKCGAAKLGTEEHEGHEARVPAGYAKDAFGQDKTLAFFVRWPFRSSGQFLLGKAATCAEPLDL